MKHLIIEGFIGSGKGAVGRMVAKKLNRQLVDIDKCVANRLKMSTAEIYDQLGEPYYRAMESIILSEQLSLEDPSVIVLGSGVALIQKNREYLKELGCVYYIRLKQQAVLGNMRTSKKHDWIRNEAWDDQVLKLYKEREPAYRKTADVVIAGDGKSVEEIADEIIAHAQGKEAASGKEAAPAQE